MLKRATSLLLALTTALGLLTVAAPANASTHSLQEGSDEAAVLFDPMKPFTVSVMRELGEPPLTHNYLDSPTYRRATVKITMSGTKKYTTIYNVGVRLKGTYTRRFEKMSLKIKFDAFQKDQSFLGLDRLTLNAMMQDESQVREISAYRLFRAMGVPAPRAGYTRVKIDGAYQGLYLNLESIDAKMLKRWFESTEHVYSGPRPCDLTPTNSCYSTSMGNADRTDVLTAGKLHLLSGKEWWTQFNKIADADRILKMLATEIYLSHWDGYGDYMRNNHFVHFDKAGKFTLIPWGTDQTFPSELKHQLTWNASKPVYLGSATERSSLITHCLDYTPCQDRLLYFGFLASQTSKNINLVGFKDQVISKISQNRFALYDTSRIDQKIRTVERKWLTDYLPMSTKALINFLLLRSPARLQVAMPETVNLGKAVTPTIQSTWEPGVNATFQWLLDGKAIANATNATYKLQESDLGHKLKLRITLKKPSVKDTIFESASRTVLAKALKYSPTPTIAGKAKLGQTLSATIGTWDEGATIKIQWLRNGNPIANSTKPTHKITTYDFGQHLTVKVTATKKNFATTIRVSEPTKKVD